MNGGGSFRKLWNNLLEMGEETEQGRGWEWYFDKKWKNAPARLLPNSLKMSSCPDRGFQTNFHNFIDFKRVFWPRILSISVLGSILLIACLK